MSKVANFLMASALNA